MKIIKFFMFVLSVTFSGCIMYPTQTVSIDQHEYNLEISKDGKYAIVTRPRNRYSTVYDIENKKVLYSKNLHYYHFSFMPDYTIVDKRLARSYALSTGERAYGKNLKSVNTKSREFFSDNKRLLLGQFKVVYSPNRIGNGDLMYCTESEFKAIRPYSFSKHDKNGKMEDLFVINKIILSKKEDYFYTMDTISVPDAVFDLYNIQNKYEYGLVKWRVSDFKPVKNFRSMRVPQKLTFDLSADGRKILISSNVFPYLCLLDATTLEPIFESVNLDRAMEILRLDLRSYYRWDYNEIFLVRYLWGYPHKHVSYPEEIKEALSKGDYIDKNYTKRYGGFLSGGKYFFVIGEKAEPSLYTRPITYKADEYIYVYSADEEMKLMTKMPFNVETICEAKRDYKVVASSQYNNKIFMMIKTGIKSGHLLVLEYDEKENKLKEYWKAPLPKKLRKRYTKRLAM